MSISVDAKAMPGQGQQGDPPRALSPPSLRAPQRRALSQEFVEFALDCGALRLGSFTTKAGRLSPYFFNAGLFNDGQKLARLAQFYQRALVLDDVDFDMVFGPAYKGIPLASALALAWVTNGRSISFAFNRKEVKAHGEGGQLMGASLMGRVLIVDDVVSAGTATQQSVTLIQQAGAKPHALVVALDRQEKVRQDGVDLPFSALQYAAQHWGLVVCAIASLSDVMTYLTAHPTHEFEQHRDALGLYQAQYGISVC
jgi:orotate phosphoribosyltransferase